MDAWHEDEFAEQAWRSDAAAGERARPCESPEQRST